jgi:c-di-GMP-binding flagellar brake protein YcgR
MARANAIDQDAAAEILSEAAERNQSLDLIRLLDGGTDACRSRFVEAPGHPVAVEVPSRQGLRVPVRPGEKVEVFFRLRERRYWFATVVASRTMIRLSGRMRLPVLVLRPPRAIELRQRRKHYRVRFGPADRLMAGLWKLSERPDKAPPEQLPSMEVLDLSVGGMRLLYARQEGCPVDEGHSIRISIRLDPDEAPLKLVGRALRVSRVVENVTHIAVEFQGLRAGPEAKAIRDRLLRFIAARQREEAQRSQKAAQGES